MMTVQVLLIVKVLLPFWLLAQWNRSVSAEATGGYAFIHYHKTGHDLSKKLASAIEHASCVKDSVDGSPYKRKNIYSHATELKVDSINIFPAPDAVFDWKRFGLNTKIVHFVRDPTDVVLSGYLYHSQVPPPSSEHWLVDSDLDLCQLNPANQKYIDAIGRFAAGTIKADIDALVVKVHNLCREMYDKYKGPTIFDTIKRADANGTNIYEGMKLEAVRSLTSVNYGDLMRMTANAVSEAQAPANMTYRIYMSEVAEGEEATFRYTVTKLLRFLNSVTSEGKACIDEDAALQLAVDAAFVDAGRAHKSGEAGAVKASHVTAGFLSPAMHEYYKQRLLRDPVLGPLLHILHLVLDATARKYTR